jgi:(p)ppGpp synthase/HD superfamily hydrolase
MGIMLANAERLAMEAMAAALDPPPTDDEMDRFFELTAPAMVAAVYAAWAEAGDPIPVAEVHRVISDAFNRVAADALREMFGGEIGALIDGRKPQ